MVFERPRKAQNSSPAIQKPGAGNGGDKHNGGSGGRGTGGTGGTGNHSKQPPEDRIPSPWLDSENEPIPDKNASFVEYLRWMRSPESEYKDATKVHILQKAEEGANHNIRLEQLNKRTKLIAKEIFQVQCPWRMRVGGHRGPESILLPAFDALGTPYIPSSTLRGVARTQAIREIMAEKKLSWKAAEQEVAPYFGSLEAKNPNDCAGKVVFLDAYPLPNQPGILAMDMANNIWKWENNSPKYDPNPNPFLCIKGAIFLIGLRLTSNCKDNQVLDKVKHWLIKGLQAGIGSQVNTGYGELITAAKVNKPSDFFQVEFKLKGQLIHGRQKIRNLSQPYQKDGQGHLKRDRYGKLKLDTSPEAEVRSVAFKSMLRYWFRTFALGVLEPEKILSWESKIFGAINPQERGWIVVRVLHGKVTQKEPLDRRDPCGEQQGLLTLSYSPEAPQDKQKIIQQLLRNLTWLMFHLGGIGQGARRPYYSRKTRDFAPWWRGSTLIPESDDAFWILPDTPKEFCQLFQQRLLGFYTAFQSLGATFNHRSPISAGSVSRDRWNEAVDVNCRIIVCAGQEDFAKPYALAVLHHQDLKIKDKDDRYNYDGNLCGKVGKEVKPSPIWIADLDDYQLVTVFGATQDPRKKYLQALRDRTSPQNYHQVYPL